MQKIVFFLLGIVFSLNVVSQNSPLFNTLPEMERKEDVTLLVAALKESLIELNMYQDSAAFENRVAELLNRKGEMTILDFYREVKKLFAPIGSDHLKVFFNSQTIGVILQDTKILPIEVRYIDNKLYCYKNHIGGELKDGCQILSINGNKASVAVQTMLDQTSAGGYIQSSKTWILNGMEFSKNYYLLIDTARNFKLEYLTLGDTAVRTTLVKGVKRKYVDKYIDSIAQANEVFTDPYGLHIDNGVAVMNIEQFYEKIDEKKFNAFYRKSFKEMKSRDVNYLIIDVRRNLGGWQPHGYNLMTYFTDKEFRPVETVLFKQKTFSFIELTNMHKKNYQLKKLERSGKYYKQNSYKPLMDAVYKPKKEQFKGQVYILTNEGTASAACFFTNAVNTFNDSVIFVGKESEMVSQGASSGIMPVLTLPNSGLNIRLPLSYFKIKSKPGLEKGRGLIPDHIIEKGLSGADKEMEYTLKLIEEKRKK